MKKKPLFIIIILLTFNLQIIVKGATDEGYGEDETCLGQFVDSFENLNNVSTSYQVERNATLNAMELNYTSLNKYDSFDQYLQIWVNSSRINENLIGFPFLIHLSGSSAINNFDATHIFDEIGNSYQKIAITNNLFADERYVEVEYWNATTEEAYIWTHGTFSNLTDTLLFLHYDIDVANNTAFIDVPGSTVAQNVWNDGYIAVWHLSENSEPYLDSTQYNNDAWELGGIVAITDQIDGGQNIPGTNDGLTVNMGLSYDDLAVEAWIDWDALAGDRAILSTWYIGGLSQGFIWFYDLAPGNRLRYLVDAGASNDNILYGDTPPAINNQYYYAGVRIRNDFIYGYQNGAETVGPAVGNTAIAFSGGNITIGNDLLTRDFDGQMDDIRISNVSRNQNWINATYYSGLDDFTTQANGTVSGGYQSWGYFTTDDYMNDTVCNGNSLVLMVNSSIPTGNIQVQFSNDNATWGDWEGTPLDSNILTGGFESIDLRYLNYTDLYLNFSFSSSDPTLTPRLYQARLISTIGNCSGAAPGPGGSGAIGFIMLILICSPLIILLWGKRK